MHIIHQCNLMYKAQTYSVSEVLQFLEDPLTPKVELLH